MVWRTPTGAKTAAQITTRIDVARTGAGILVGVTDDDGRRGVAA